MTIMNSHSRLPRKTQRLLRAFGFTFRRGYPSRCELWLHRPEPFRLFVGAHRPPRTIYELMLQIYRFGWECGRDGERLRVADDFGIPMDDLVFGKEE